MKIKRKVITLFINVILSKLVLAIAFVPEIFYLDLIKKETNELIIINNSGERKRYSVGLGFNEESEYKILKEWVKFYPETLSLEPEKRGIMRFKVEVPRVLKDGEYTGFIFLEEVGSNKEKKQNFTLSIYGQAGEEVYESKVWKSEVTGGKLVIEIENLGNFKLRPVIKIEYLDGEGNVIERDREYLSLITVGDRREVEYDLDLNIEGIESLVVNINHYNYLEKKDTYQIFSEKRQLSNETIKLKKNK